MASQHFRGPKRCEAMSELDSLRPLALGGCRQVQAVKITDLENLGQVLFLLTFPKNWLTRFEPLKKSQRNSTGKTANPPLEKVYSGQVKWKTFLRPKFRSPSFSEELDDKIRALEKVTRIRCEAQVRGVDELREVVDVPGAFENSVLELFEKSLRRKKIAETVAGPKKLKPQVAENKRP